MGKSLLTVVNTARQVVTMGGAIAFNIVGLRSGLRFYPGSSSIIVKKSGTYTYNFKIDGESAVPEKAPCLSLTVNGVIVASTCALNNGSGLISVRRGDLVTLQLVPDSPSGNMTLNSNEYGGAPTASLSLAFFER